MRLNVFIQRIEGEKARVAKEAMESPSADVFAHGRIVGVYAGLDLAQNLLLDLLAEKERNDFNL